MMKSAASRILQVIGWGLVALALLIAGAAVPDEGAFFVQLFLVALPVAMLGAAALFIGRRLTAPRVGSAPVAAGVPPPVLTLAANWRVRISAALAVLALLLAVVLAARGAVDTSVNDDAEGFGLLILVVVSPLVMLGVVLAFYAFVESRSAVPGRLSVSRSRLVLVGGGALLGGAMAVLYDAQAIAFLLLIVAIVCAALVWRDLHDAETSR